MKNIAVYVNATGITASIKEEGTVRIYTKNLNSWIVTKEIPCSINFSVSLSEVRKKIVELLLNITDCRIFAATEISGQLYYLLEANGYASYETEGEPEQYLDTIMSTELDEISECTAKGNEKTTAMIPPEPTDQLGVYSINLRNALACLCRQNGRWRLKWKDIQHNMVH